MLFILFINDLPSSLPPSVNISLYADDLAIWASDPSVPRATAAVQAALDSVSQWSSEFLLPLNPQKCEVSFFSTDPYQANLQPSLFLYNTALTFNPTPIFLGVTFDRTLSFSSHSKSLRSRLLPRLRALKSISLQYWGPQKESLSTLYVAFCRSVLTYAAPAWFPFSSPSHLNPLYSLHLSGCRAVTGCFSSTPSSLLLSEAGLPPLSLTLSSSALSFFDRALRLPPSHPLHSLASAPLFGDLSLRPLGGLMHFRLRLFLISPLSLATLYFFPPPFHHGTHFLLFLFLKV